MIKKYFLNLKFYWLNLIKFIFYLGKVYCKFGIFLGVVFYKLIIFLIFLRMLYIISVLEVNLFL